MGHAHTVVYLQGKKVDKGVTNVRNTASPHWRRWLGRRTVAWCRSHPFLEPTRLPDGSSAPAWFALDKSRPLAFSAGIRTGWTCVRKLAENEVPYDLLAFLTTEPNVEAGTIHPKAMPLILKRDESGRPG